MQIGQRIKQARQHRKLTQKQLGLMVGFDDNTADVRIAQYESSTRTPKDDMRNKLAIALKVNPRYFSDSNLSDAEDIVFLLFELDNIHKLDLIPLEDGTKTKVNIHLNNDLVNNFLVGWATQKQALANREITQQEYTDWILSWPSSVNNIQKEE